MRPTSSLAAGLPCLLMLASCVGPAGSQPANGTARAASPRAAASPPVRPAPSRAQPSASGPASAPAATPLASPAALRPSAWADRPLTPGTWSYRADPASPAAIFGRPGAAPLLTLRCDRAGRRLVFVRPSAGRGAMTVRTSYGAQSWPATTGANGETIAARAASDAGLDQIAYSRGRFAVEMEGLAPLTLPAWAEVSRVIEDCRS